MQKFVGHWRLLYQLKYSKSYCDDIRHLFKVMFTDSKVAELFLYGKAKSRYFIMHDLKRNPKILSFMVLPQCL